MHSPGFRARCCRGQIYLFIGQIYLFIANIFTLRELLAVTAVTHPHEMLPAENTHEEQDRRDEPGEDNHHNHLENRH